MVFIVEYLLFPNILVISAECDKYENQHLLISQTAQLKETGMSSLSLHNGDIFVPLQITEDDLFGGVIKLLEILRPTWDSNAIKFKMFTDGITNKLVACYLNGTKFDEDTVLVRIYGNKTDLLIDRAAELRNIKVLNKINLAPKIYGVFENGIAYEYLPGVTLNTDTVLDPKIWTAVAQRMAVMHRVELGKEVPREPFLWDKIEQFLRLLPEPFSDPDKQNRFVSSFGSVTKLRIEYERLKSFLSKVDSPIVFAHNDLLLGNVIHNEAEGTISFIDYEYAAYNYQAFDIANHFNEFVGLSIQEIDYKKYPNKSFQIPWIKIYFKKYTGNEAPADEDIEKLYSQVEQFSIASHFLWGIWSLVQFDLSHIDFDFGRYAEIRLGRYYELKDKVFKQLS